jgi:hypothetical protein
VLAAISDYFRAWQTIHILLFTVGSVGVGSWLLLKSMKARPEFRRPRLGKCVGILVVALAAGGLSAASFLLLVYGIGVAIDVNLKSLAAVVAMVMAWPAVLAAMYAMLEVPFAQAMKMAARPVVAMLVIGAPLGVDVLIRTRGEVSRENRTRECRYNLSAIAGALVAYQRSYGDPAPDLASLAAHGDIPAELLRCPAAPNEQVGYFYIPARIRTDEGPSSIIVCDFAGNHPDGRNVLLSNGSVMFDDPEDFADELKQGPNLKFAEALKAEELKQDEGK